MATTPSLFWHDYETFGVDPQRDRPAQFAGVRTDLAFNLLNDPVCWFCEPPEDYLPQPDACVITKLTPQAVAAQGAVNEAEFARRIYQQLTQPNTCTLGYNNLRFDDEVTRHLLYRNFYDPYAREWQQGNSRWDLLDVVRAARALRPEGIQWPVNAEGAPSVKLEDLSAANDIAHSNAHDALADVYATIALAKLLKTAQPKLFDFLWQHRTKVKALGLLHVGQFRPLVHISGMYSAAKNYLAIVLPLAMHPTNANEVIVYDLAFDPQPLLSLDVAAIQTRLFTATAQLPEGTTRIPLKTVHINKCPVLAPLNVIRPQDAERLTIDFNRCQQYAAQLARASDLPEKLAQVYQSTDVYPVNDVELALYSGGFLTNRDRQLSANVLTATPAQLATTHFSFQDVRLPELLWRYRARNFPDTLSEAQTEQWRAFCLARLTGEQPGLTTTLPIYLQRLQALRATGEVAVELLAELEQYAVEKMQRLGYAAPKVA